MRINHKLIKISVLSKMIGLTATALHMKQRGRKYQKLTADNLEKIKVVFYEMIAYLFRIETKEDFEEFKKDFFKYLFK